MKWIIFAFFFVGVSAEPADQAVDVQIGFEQRFEPELERQLYDTLRSALIFVAAFPPKHLQNHVFDWTADRSILQGKTFTVSFGTTNSPSMKLLPSSGPAGISPHLDAITVATVGVKERSMPIRTILFVDKIFYSEGFARTDSLGHLIIALAHEIYGNVQRFLLLDFKDVKPMTEQMRAEGEVETYETSVRFLEDLAKDKDFLRQPAEIRSQILAQLPREREGLEAWRKSLRICRGIL